MTDPGALEHCSPGEAQGAVRSLESKGMLLRADSGSIDSIIAHLIENPAHGPLVELPDRGHWDLTLRGARLWEEIEHVLGHSTDRTYEVQHFSDWVCHFSCCSEEKQTVLGRLRDFCKEQQSSAGQVFAVDGPRDVGPWRDRWWRTVIPRGYRIEAMIRISQATDLS